MVHTITQLERRMGGRAEEDSTFAHSYPDVLIGAGHDGLELAGRLKALGTSSLLIGKEARLGDDWRLRCKVSFFARSRRITTWPTCPSHPTALLGADDPHPPRRFVRHPPRTESPADSRALFGRSDRVCRAAGWSAVEAKL